MFYLIANKFQVDQRVNYIKSDAITMAGQYDLPFGIEKYFLNIKSV